MLTLGITLNLCDVVFMLNDTMSMDKILQMMYRCMTEAPNKKCGYVVDFKISRVSVSYTHLTLPTICSV